MACRVVLAVVVLVMLPGAHAQEAPPKPTVHEQAAAKVAAAHAAGDRAAIEALAKDASLVPWMVVYALLGDGNRDAALAYAKACRGIDNAGLPAYVAGWRDSEEGRAARGLLARAIRALQGGDADAALEILEGAPGRSPALVACRLASCRARALRKRGRHADAEAAFGRSMELAMSIGWLDQSWRTCGQARNCAHARRDLDATMLWCERQIRIARRRKNPVLEGLVLGDMSNFLGPQGKLDEARILMDRARKILEPRTEDDPRAAHGLSWSLAQLGGHEERRGQYVPALAHLLPALALMRRRKDPSGIAYCQVWIGGIHAFRGRSKEARQALEEALEVGRAPGAGAWEGHARCTLANMDIRHGAYRKAHEHLTRAREVFRAQRSLPDEAEAVADLARTSWNLALPREAREFQTLALALVERLRERPDNYTQRCRARALWRLGHLQENQGDHAVARTSLRAALEIYERLGVDSGRADCLGGLGIVHWRLSEFRDALSMLERARNLYHDVGDLGGVAGALTNLGLVHESLGSYREALTCLERAYEIEERSGTLDGGTILNLALIHGRFGRRALQLSLYERALRVARQAGDLAGEAIVLWNLAWTLRACGDPERAREVQAEGARLWTRIGNPRGVAKNAYAVASQLVRDGELAAAASLFSSNVEAWVEIGDREQEATARAALGGALRELGKLGEAREALQQARDINETIGDTGGVLYVDSEIAILLTREGRDDEAVSLYRRVAAEADRLGGFPDIAINALGGLSGCQLARGKHAEALAASRKIVGHLGTLLRGFGEEQGAARRAKIERSYRPYEEGARAAAALGSAVDLCFFLESGRAGGMLESLGGRERTRGIVIPKDLRDEDTDARAAELVAQRDIRERHRRGEEPSDAERKALAAARKQVVEVVEKIQREAKLAAAVVYPKADALETIQGRLGADEALVLYGMYEAEVLALVVSSGEAHIARLGEPGPIQEAARALMRAGRWGSRAVRLVTPDPASQDPDRFAAVLRARVVTPLGLGKSVTRVFVSPHGALAEVPFCLLLGDREVVYVPSGTAHGVVTAAGRTRGDGVLALGAPIYEGSRTPLAASGEEARAVGDVVLLGAKATETALRVALTTRPRWRSLHLACHGMVDPVNPTMSALALTPEETTDGFLTGVEVVKLGASTDLVALSACRTGRGKSFEAEGVLGLTRAFLVAGAPRVLCSLWDVDDRATRVLMERFYLLWNPKDGTAGLPAVRALRMAQEHVRNHPDHPDWKAPYYWAAWMLWGDPD